MTTLQERKPAIAHLPISRTTSLVLHEGVQHNRLVNVVVLVVVGFQCIDLLGAIINHSAITVGVALFGLILCSLAWLFNRRGRIPVSSLFLIIVINLGCGLILITSPGGRLDVTDLPVYDVLIISEIISVSLLPAISVFPLAAINVLFTVSDLLLQPHTPALQQLLSSGMAYTVVSLPVSLQILVAVVSYLWVRSALRALARADRAEEIGELQRREAERTQQLEVGMRQVLDTHVRAANGDFTARVNLQQENVLWQVGVSLNLLLTRLQKASRVEAENQRLRAEVARLNERMHKPWTQRNYE